MKIAYIANVRIPTEKAHGIQIMKMCEAFADAGQAVDLIVPRRINFLKKDPYDFYGVKRNFAIRRLWCVDFLAFPFFKRTGFFLASLSFLISAEIYCFFRKFDAFYTRELGVAAVLSFLAPVFYEIHNFPGRVNFLHRFSFSRSAKLIVISDGLRKELISAGMSSEKIIIARDGVDLRSFSIMKSKDECRSELGLPADKKIVLYAGHLYAWKGADVLADAADFLPDDVLVYIVGGTKKDMADFSARHKNKNLNITGWQEPQRIPLWLKAADLLILPTSSRTKIGSDYTSPLKLFEYLASGTPIIASNLPSLREVVTDKEVIFFEPDNAGSLVQKITWALEHESVLRELALSAEKIAGGFSWRKRADKILSAIK